MIGIKEASIDVYHGLLALQHRGQDACGILSFDKISNGFYLDKGHGLVGNHFSEDRFSKLSGDIAIGHVRYPTVGICSIRDAQPFFIESKGGIGMAHNGNVSNVCEIKEKLVRNNWYINSNSDSEIILKCFADGLSHCGTVQGLFDAVKYVFDNAYPSYSSIAIIAGKGLLAFRDTRGIRPLVFGKKITDGKTSYAFSSETVALNNLGYEVERDVRPGEAIFVDMTANFHSQQIYDDEHKHCMFEWVYFARPESEMEKRHLYHVRERLGSEIAKELKHLKADYVIAVPDTSRTAALSIAGSLGIPYKEGLIKNRYIGRSFIMNCQNQRENCVKLKLNVVHPNVKGKRLIVVDDSIVRGTTLRIIAGMLRQAGAEEIHMVSTCPPIVAPCFWGVDFPEKDELVAYEKSVSQIRDEMGVDTLTYMTMEALKKAVGIDDLCIACLGGKAPTCTKHIAAFANMRKSERNSGV